MASDNTIIRVNAQTKWEEISCPVCGGDAFTFLFKKLEEPFVRCNGCDLVMINPRPHFEDVLNTYDADYGQLYFKKKDKKMRRIRPWVRRIKKHFVAGGRWLDIGCSVGFVVYCSKEAGFEAFGVDVEPWGLEYARNELGLENVSQGTLEAQNYSDGYFDVLSIYDVIEHVPDLNAFVAELKRILAPGGVIDLRTPDEGHWRVPSNLADWEAILPSEHLYNFNHENLETLFNKHGLKIVKKRFNLKPGIKIYVTHQ